MDQWSLCARLLRNRFPRGILNNHRNKVLGFLALLLVITYLDRVCISVAGPRMQEALHIGPVGWGRVVGVFTISYALFEIPSGVLGDKIGPRRVLTRIVLWWSAFTTITGRPPDSIRCLPQDSSSGWGKPALTRIPPLSYLDGSHFTSVGARLESR